MSDYGAGKSLNNTLNDADDMADVLTRLGFEVTLLKNNDLRNLKTHLANWYTTLEGNYMAVFYFAGHGMEVSGENYLIPVDAVLNSQTDVEYNALNVNQVLGNMDEKRVDMKLLILDACRDNPFKRSWSRGSEEKGLAGMNAPGGTYIAFAASPGLTAQDGANYHLKNGVFTHFLKQEILKEGISIDEIFNNVTGAVATLTHNQQIPFKNSSLTKNFYFIMPNDKPAPSPPVDDKPVPSPPAPVVDANVEALLRQADTYYNSGQYSKALSLYKQAADKGNAKAQANLGICYYYGLAVTIDYEQAVSWLREAALQGKANAQTTLGACYNSGNGVKKDYNEAVFWYRKAANQGEANAQTNLGACYYNGWGVTKDYSQAVEWYKKAANQGKSNAQYNLGSCYESGNGVTKDYKQATYWYRKAANQGDEDAKKALKRLKVSY